MYFYIKNQYSVSCVLFLFLLALVYNFYQYSTQINKKLQRLFESIQYQDFAITFKNDNKLGDSFKDLNTELNAVIRSFNQVRQEREASLHFIQAIVQQVNVGLLSYGTDGKIEISNQAAANLLGLYRLHHIDNIKTTKLAVYELITSLNPNESKLLKLENTELSFTVNEILLKGKKLRLVAIHNIKSELQIRELEAWQNLTKVLRHEIMNSVTPIVSMAETMQDIVENDLKTSDNQEAIQDLKQALSTVKNRSKGIMNFVNAYREFTNIPEPQPNVISIETLFDNLKNLYKKSDPKGNHTEILFEIEKVFNLNIDQEQIEQVLINIIKNAIEAKSENKDVEIIVRASIQKQTKTIEIFDNGQGINDHQIEKIFVPFFTTKAEGSGVGLSLSRQIMQLHGGSLSYRPNLPKGSIFELSFNQ